MVLRARALDTEIVRWPPLPSSNFWPFSSLMALSAYTRPKNLI